MDLKPFLVKFNIRENTKETITTIDIIEKDQPIYMKVVENDQPINVIFDEPVFDAVPEVKPGKIIKRIIVHNPKVKGGQYGRKQLVNLEQEAAKLFSDHYSRVGNLVNLDPAFHGTGVAGQERKRKRDYPEIYVDRIYHYAAGADPEAALAKRYKYSGQFHEDDIYDFIKDPLNIQSHQLKETGGNQGEALTRMERDIQERGYVGMKAQIGSGNPILAIFQKHDASRVRSFKVNISGASTDSNKKRMKEMVDLTKKSMETNNQKDIYSITREALKNAYDSPFINVDDMREVMGVYFGDREASFEMHMSGDPDVILGRTALFLKTFDQDSGIMTEMTNDRETLEPVGTKRSGAYTINLGESDIGQKEVMDLITKHGFAGATYDPDNRNLYMYHLPEFMRKPKPDDPDPTKREGDPMREPENFQKATKEITKDLLKYGIRAEHDKYEHQFLMQRDGDAIDNKKVYNYYIKRGIDKERSLLTETYRRPENINRTPYPKPGKA